MIDEKKAVSALKAAYKGGYHVEFCGEYISVQAGYWALRVRSEWFPAKLLGLIVEHIGAVPEPDTAYKLRKDEAPQCVELAIEEGAWDAILKDMEQSRPIKKTDLTMSGDEIWQEQDQLRCVRVDPEFSRIIKTERQKEAEVFDDMKKLCWKRPYIWAVVCAKTRDQQLERLDGRTWCGEDGG